jgi:hypothetical protein
MKAFTKNNINQAWYWLRTNPDNKYKKYFRSSYGRFSVVEKYTIRDICSEISKKIYQPTSCIRLYSPKKSGGLRPMSLISVKDQIVYQAIGNVVAEKLTKNKHYRKNTFSKVFGNIYAGPKSKQFYSYWKEGYEGFKSAIKKSHGAGNHYVADFDIAACFDTVDHKVLSTLLTNLGVNKDLTVFLINNLEKWTEADSDPGLMRNHGLPQGPLTSGLLAEVVLKEFDNCVKVSGVDYFRYVDDIKLMASSETDLRIALVQLDLKAKTLGLIPQSAKINIHKIENIEEEYKTVSINGEFIETFNKKNDFFKNIFKKLTNRNKIADETRFKYYFPALNPSYDVTRKVLKLYKVYPHLFEIFHVYLLKLPKLTDKLAMTLTHNINDRQAYDLTRASYVDTLLKSDMSSEQKKYLIKYLKEKVWKATNTFKNDHEYLFVIIASALINANILTQKRIEYIFKNISWFGQVVLLERLDKTEKLNEYVVKEVKKCTASINPDVQLAASQAMIKLLTHDLDSVEDIDTTVSIKKSGHHAHKYFEVLGFAATNPVTSNSIGLLLNELFGGSKVSFHHIDWNNLFQKEYMKVWRTLLLLKASEESNAADYINLLDNFNEILVRRLFDIFNLGAVDKYGGVFPYEPGKKCKFYMFNKVLFYNFKQIHTRRNENFISHPGASHIENRLFTYSEIKKYRKLEISGLIGMIRKGTYLGGIQLAK